MGKHCTQEFLDCVLECHRKYGTSWRSYACTLDCELTFAACVVRDFSRALQGKELAQASEIAKKMEDVGNAYLVAATNLRSKTSIGYATKNVVKRDGTTESFYPESKLLPSLVRSGVDIMTARLVTDRVTAKFYDEMATEDIKAESIAELETIDPEMSKKCDCKTEKHSKTEDSTTTKSSE